MNLSGLLGMNKAAHPDEETPENASINESDEQEQEEEQEDAPSTEPVTPSDDENQEDDTSDEEEEVTEVAESDLTAAQAFIANAVTAAEETAQQQAIDLVSVCAASGGNITDALTALKAGMSADDFRAQLSAPDSDTHVSGVHMAQSRPSILSELAKAKYPNI